MKTEARDEARRLRLEGASVREIEVALGVARSSVSRWVRDIQLTAEQRGEIELRSGAGRLAWAEAKAERAREQRRLWQEEGRLRARTASPSYVAGCMLYWGEGSKSRGSASLVNSDLDLLRVFADFLREHFAVSNEIMRLRCSLFTDHVARQAEVERYWLEGLGLTEASLTRSRVNSYSKYSQRKRVNMLPYGTARLAVHRTQILQTIYGSIQELAGIDRPEWLD